MTTPFTLTQGRIPLLVSFPHVGTDLLPGLAQRLTPAAKDLPDTDWLLPDLYDFLTDLGASTLVAHYSRYVVDLNRPATDESLYPGQTTTGLFPAKTFTGEPVWQTPLTQGERDQHRDTVWAPYHTQLSAELERLKARHGYALLWDAHSIAPELPRLFEGRLPDLNLGSNGGQSCPPAVAQAVLQAAEAFPAFTRVLDGRFKGGHITRHYGRPDQRVFALQLELSQATHLADGLPAALDPARCATLRPCLRAMVHAFTTESARFLEPA